MKFLWGLMSLTRSDVNVNFSYMRNCLLHQSEANGPRLDHMTFLLSACMIFFRQRGRVDPTEMHTDFGRLGCILNIDSAENRLAECSVRFIYIQQRCPVGFSETTTYWQAVGSDVWELFAIACTSKGVIANLIRLFVGATAEETHLVMIATPHTSCGSTWMRIAHTPLCTISVNVNCRDDFVFHHGVYAM